MYELSCLYNFILFFLMSCYDNTCISSSVINNVSSKNQLSASYPPSEEKDLPAKMMCNEAVSRFIMTNM